MSEHPIESVMKTTMENLKEMIDVNTIVGDAVETSEGTVIIPISKVSFGFVAGGGEYSQDVKEGKKNNQAGDEQNENEKPFAGGSGAGVSVNPIAFLVVGEDKINLMPVQFNSTVDRLVELVPQVMGEVKNLLGSKIKNKEQPVTETVQ